MLRSKISVRAFLLLIAAFALLAPFVAFAQAGGDPAAMVFDPIVAAVAAAIGAPVWAVWTVIRVAIKLAPIVVTQIENAMSDKPGPERLAAAVAAIEADMPKIASAVPGLKLLARPAVKYLIERSVKTLPVTRNRAGAPVK